MLMRQEWGQWAKNPYPITRTDDVALNAVKFSFFFIENSFERGRCTRSAFYEIGIMRWLHQLLSCIETDCKKIELK